MGFDPIQYALCQNHAKESRIAWADSYFASTANAGTTPDCQADFAGYTTNCYRFSNLTPSDSDILSAEITFLWDTVPVLTATKNEILGTNERITAFIFSDPDSSYEPPAAILISVREPGEHTVECVVDAETTFTLSLNAQQSGLYYIAEEPLPDAVSVTMQWETIHPIDPKFLPGVCLPVVEIADFDNITAKESAALTACIGAPCAISTGGAFSIFSVANYAYNGNHFFTIATVTGVRSICSMDNGATWSTVQ